MCIRDSINNQQTVFIKAVNELASIIGIHSGQRIQYSGKVGHQNRNTLSTRAFAMHPAKNDLPIPTSPQDVYKRQEWK